MPRFFIFIISILLLSTIGFGAYILFIVNQDEAPPLADESRVQEEPKTNMQALTDEAVLSPVLSFDNEKVWYMTGQGKLYRHFIDSGLTEEYSLPEEVVNPVNIVWQEDGSNFIVETLADGHTRHMLYDAGSDAFIDYPAQIRRPVFLESRQGIVYDWIREDGAHELKTADITSQEFRIVAELFRPDYRITAAPAESRVILTAASDASAAELFLVDIQSGNFTAIGAESLRSSAKFSPDGSKLLIDERTAEQVQGELAVYDLKTLERTTLGIFGKAAAAAWGSGSKSVFVITGGDLVLVDTASGNRKILHAFADEENLKASNMIAHPDENIVFFVDEGTGFLYRVDY